MSAPRDPLPANHKPPRAGALDAARGLVGDRRRAEAVARRVALGVLAASLAGNVVMSWHMAAQSAAMAELIKNAPVTIVQYDTSGQRAPEVVRALKGEPVDFGEEATISALKRWVRQTNEYTRPSIAMQFETALPLMCDDQRDGLVHYFSDTDPRGLFKTYGDDGRAHVQFPSNAVTFLPTKGQALVMYDLTVDKPGHALHGKTRRMVAQITYRHTKVPQGDPTKPEFAREVNPTGVCVSSSREGN